ncbi:hypothetical protein K8I31_20380 [bacterium]|nr:hypothetical protein [bacterium]
MRNVFFKSCLISLFIGMLLPIQSIAKIVDLSDAVVVVPRGQEQELSVAVDMLLDEIEKRSQIRLEVAHGLPDENVLRVIIAKSEDSKGDAEGYTIRFNNNQAPPALVVAGHDKRGALFGCGRLLRELSMAPGKISIDDSIDIAESPKYPLRGHQLGYRPKTNSYDAWSVDIWEQYLRDLVVFGTNAIELIPPNSDDADTSPHFPLPQMEMMIEMSRLADKYDMDVWVWYPAIGGDYENKQALEKSIKEWGAVISKLPRLDAVFVPGGDPGETPPAILMTLLEKQYANLQQHHPGAELWASTQGFHKEWMDEFIQILHDERPAWLRGVVFGPQNLISLPELRERVPTQYPIRRYPDITHNIRCQYAVQEWDVAYAATEHRESINPRPVAMANIFRIWDELACGFISYSEGCNDDVNKILWSSLGWNPDADVKDILRQYARYFIGEEYEEPFAQGLLSLETNWRAPLLTNRSVYTTLQQFQTMEKNASPKLRLNWRFQQALYRAYYDAYTRKRLLYETELEESAMDMLRRADEIGAEAAMDNAQDILSQAVENRVANDWRSRVFELGEALYQSIRMQLSVEKYQAIHAERGANLDFIDRPLNNRNWLTQQFASIRKLDNESQRLQALDEIINWTNPGPGGYYDDLGDLANQPHLVRGEGWQNDPEFRNTSRMAFDYFPMRRMSWVRFAETRYGKPLEMRYDGLDTNTQYRIKFVYTGEHEYHGDIKVRCEAEGVEIHPYRPKPDPVRPLEFDIPKRLTQDGALSVKWFDNPERTGAGRGCQVGEVWLMKRDQ